MAALELKNSSHFSSSTKLKCFPMQLIRTSSLRDSDAHLFWKEGLSLLLAWEMSYPLAKVLPVKEAWLPPCHLSVRWWWTQCPSEPRCDSQVLPGAPLSEWAQAPVTAQNFSSCCRMNSHCAAEWTGTGHTHCTDTFLVIKCVSLLDHF